MATRRLKVTTEGVTLDQLLWREFKTEVELRFERTLAGNKMLAEAGLFLPLGAEVEVEIPETTSEAPPVVRVRRLWG